MLAHPLFLLASDGCLSCGTYSSSSEFSVFTFTVCKHDRGSVTTRFWHSSKRSGLGDTEISKGKSCVHPHILCLGLTWGAPSCTWRRWQPILFCVFLRRSDKHFDGVRVHCLLSMVCVVWIKSLGETIAHFPLADQVVWSWKKNAYMKLSIMIVTS